MEFEFQAPSEIPSFQDFRPFHVGVDSFDGLTILETAASSTGGYHVFYDSRSHARVRDFVLDDRSQVATMCRVTLIWRDGAYSPRLRFWKKDKTKASNATADERIEQSIDDMSFVKSSVDLGQCHENCWRLLNWLITLRDIELPPNTFQVVEGEKAQLIALIESIGERSAVIEAIGETVGSTLTDRDITLLANRRSQLLEFERLLTDEAYFKARGEEWGTLGREGVWQRFLETNKWIFGYGLQLITHDSVDQGKLERITTGADIFGGGGRRADAIMRSRGLVSTLLFCEIKHHQTDLLGLLYRKPDVFSPSRELVGGVSQLQKTTQKALSRMDNQMHRLKSADGTPTDITFSSTRPRQVLLVGSLSEFETANGPNLEKLETFELFRKAFVDVDIVTFDELYERAKFIVSDQ